MIKDSFTYIAVLIFAAAVLVYLPRLIKGNAARKFFSFAPPVVLIYLGLMALCTLGAWDLQATSAAYSSLKNPLLYASPSGRSAEAGWAAAETCWRYRRRLTSANPQWRMNW